MALSTLSTPDPRSLRSRLLSLSQAQRAAAIEALAPEHALALRHCWQLWARDDQLPPSGDWRIWLALAGRGWGKTRTGAETVHHWARTVRKARIAVVGRTFRDARGVMVEGESGILATALPGEVEWSPGKGELRWTRTGSLATIYTADRPDQLRGPQHHYAWGDEVAAWRTVGEYHALDQLLYGLRLGVSPRVVLTTTPRATPELRDLMRRDGVHVTRGRTRDNASNLAPGIVAALEARYAGTRLGRQELDAEVLDDVEGALWRMATIEACRVDVVPCDLRRVVVAVDPATTSGEESDETGVIVVGLGTDDRCYVLADLSGRYSVAEWPQVVVSAYRQHAADAVVVEVNQGGDMVSATLRTVDPRLSIREVRASRGKATRAEPVSSLYLQGRVAHVGEPQVLARLEDQLTTWVPGRKSPDRLDALVWGVTDLALGEQAGDWGDPVTRDDRWAMADLTSGARRAW